MDTDPGGRSLEIDVSDSTDGCRWMAFIDIDEFLMPSPSASGSQIEGSFPLRSILTSYEDHPADALAAVRSGQEYSSTRQNRSCGWAQS
eukprot:738348-Hanusia_phi.AAC.5